MKTNSVASPELDEQASVGWIYFPENPEAAVVYGGGSADFESATNAVRFVMEQLPAHQRATAHIYTDSGRTYWFSDIVSIYRALAPAE